MKKIVAILMLVLMSVISAGCGKPSAVEQCHEILTKYRTAFDKGSDEFQKAMAKSSDFSQERIDAGQKWKSTLETISKSIDKEHLDSKEGQDVLTAYNEVIKACFRFIDMGIFEQKNGRGSVSKEKVKKMQNNIDCAVFTFRNKIEKFTTGHEINIIKYKGVRYIAYESSNVLTAIKGFRYDPNYLGENPYYRVTPVGKFLTVSVIVKNQQRDEITVHNSNYKLLDSQGREFSTSSEGWMALKMEDSSLKGNLTPLNPRMTIEIKCVFDIPTDAQASDFKLVARGGLSGDKIEIPLEVDKVPDGV